MSQPTAPRRRRPRGVAVFLAALILLPVVEIGLAIQVGQLIGGLWTVLLLLLGVVAGGFVIRREGMAAVRALDSSLRTRTAPARAPADSALVLLGGVLLLTPGFVTDVLGLLLLLPVTRPAARRLLTTWAGRQLERAVLVGGGRLRPGGRTPDVVEGEVVDVEVLEVRDLTAGPTPVRDDEGRSPKR